MLVAMGIFHFIGYVVSAIAAHLYFFMGAGEEPNLTKKWRIVAHIVYFVFWVGIFLDNIGF